MSRIEVEPGYTIAPKYIDLDEDEELCPECRGKGDTVAVYGSPHYGGNRRMTCFNCGGLGKVAYCAECKGKRHIIKHKAAPWMDDYCLDCIVKDKRFQASAAIRRERAQ